MKFVIATQELNYLINKCQNIVAQKTTVPILSNILLEAYNDEIIVTATDLTLSIRCYGEAKILEEGGTTLPAKRFAQLIRELTTPNVELSIQNEITEISANTSRFKLHGMSKNEYPNLPDVAEAVQFKIEQSVLKDMFYRTSFAVSKEENRYVLTGVCLTVQGGIATFVGTDGKRLAKAHVPIQIDPNFTGTYIIPIKAVEEISKNLLEQGEATIFLMNDKIAVEGSNISIITKLLAGEYPDVNRVIPQNPEILLVLHREELMTLLRQISLFIPDNHHSVRFTFAEGEVRLTANTMEIGEGKVCMPVNYLGPKLEIAFNPSFFLDILRHCKNETVTMGVTDPYNPGILTDNDTLQPDSSPLFVLMPMRLSED